MPKSILCVGFKLATDLVGYADFSQKLSLLDWDMILFVPTIPSHYFHPTSTFQGKYSLGEDSSFSVRDSQSHWKREIQQAVLLGKTVVVFLTEYKKFYVDSGNCSYLGTGRNRQTTTHVDPADNYDSLPVELTPTMSAGKLIKLAPHAPEAIRYFWDAMKDDLYYNVTVAKQVGQPCLITTVGDRTVGTVVRSSEQAGWLVLLPDVDFDKDDFTESDGKYSSRWTNAAREFAARFVSEIVALDARLQSDSEHSIRPDWAQAESYSTAEEQVLNRRLSDVESIIRQAQTSRQEMLAELRHASRLRVLLYETGRPLEDGIIVALRILGFSAEGYEDSTSEFDAVFQSVEGRLIGEAEGKDSKPINVEKMRQLNMNVLEDLQKDVVTFPAKGVLFGNGYRLKPISERPEQFTDKCIASSRLMSIALVRTSDLFFAAKYVLDSGDQTFATLCRQKLLESVGIVNLALPGSG